MLDNYVEIINGIFSEEFNFEKAYFHYTRFMYYYRKRGFSRQRLSQQMITDISVRHRADRSPLLSKLDCDTPNMSSVIRTDFKFGNRYIKLNLLEVIDNDPNLTDCAIITRWGTGFEVECVILDVHNTERFPSDNITHDLFIAHEFAHVICKVNLLSQGTDVYVLTHPLHKSQFPDNQKAPLILDESMADILAIKLYSRLSGLSHNILMDKTMEGINDDYTEPYDEKFEIEQVCRKYLNI